MSSDPAPVRMRWPRRLRNVFVGATATVAIVAILGFFAVPPIAKTQIEKLATNSLGRQATLGKVEFNPFTLKATLSDFRLAAWPGR